jgi:hypothetical protein
MLCKRIAFEFTSLTIRASIVILHVWTGSENSVIQTFMYSSFVFYLPEDGHTVGRNM